MAWKRFVGYHHKKCRIGFESFVSFFCHSFFFISFPLLYILPKRSFHNMCKWHTHFVFIRSFHAGVSGKFLLFPARSLSFFLYAVGVGMSFILSMILFGLRRRLSAFVNEYVWNQYLFISATHDNAKYIHSFPQYFGIACMFVCATHIPTRKKAIFCHPFRFYPFYPLKFRSRSLSFPRLHPLVLFVFCKWPSGISPSAPPTAERHWVTHTIVGWKCHWPICKACVCVCMCRTNTTIAVPNSIFSVK